MNIEYKYNINTVLNNLLIIYWHSIHYINLQPAELVLKIQNKRVLKQENIIKTNEISITQFMVPIQNVKKCVGPIWNTGGTETEIRVPVSVLGPEWAGTEMCGDRPINFSSSITVIVTKTIRFLITELQVLINSSQREN